MDIKRFFDSVDTSILKTLIRKQVQDEKILQIIDMIIDSFFHTKTADKTSGIPLGNLTSQIFANIYLHELDLFIKHKLKEQFYLRYCDDFIILSKHKERLQALIPIIQNFLTNQLHLQLHPKKISIRPLKQGIDFIGYVLYPKHTLIRPKTKKRALKRLRKCAEMGKANINQTLQSYLGILSHCHQYTFSQTLKNVYG
jgi:RNA-directed DNA polymerase